MWTFDQFADAEAMREILQQRLPEFGRGNLIITQCDKFFAGYKNFLRRESQHKASLSVGYQIEVSDSSGRQCGQQMLYVKAFLDGSSEQRFNSARAGTLVPPRFGVPLTHLPEIDAIVWAFPNDPQLPHLAEVIDPKRVVLHFPYEALPAGLDAPCDLTDVRVQVIRYLPEKRCISRYSLQWGPAESPHTVSLIGKTFSDESGQDLFLRLRRLWLSAKEQSEGFVFAQPVSYDSRVKTVWQEAVVGVPLISLMRTARRDELIAAIARGLARFHQTAPVSPTTFTLCDHLKDLRSKTNKLRSAFPASREALGLLGQYLERDAAQLAPSPQTMIHGDFHLRQLLVHGERIVCFDFDECALGDPLQDLASLIVDLYFYDFDAADVKCLGEQFLRAYKEQIDWDVPVKRLNWYLRLQFITKAYRHYRKHSLGAVDRVDRIVSLAQKVGLDSENSGSVGDPI